ncbi:MAG: hypothetical protein C0518_00205 [Opitutus sp.]|nr:hypothetical protein [Opitutus sp.]
MKKTLTTLLATAALVLAPALFAADNAKPADKKDEKCCTDCKDCKCEKGKCACDKKEKKVMLTGSHLPQTVTKVGRITDSIQPVSVYTSEDLLATGETDIASALRKLSPRIR